MKPTKEEITLLFKAVDQPIKDLRVKMLTQGGDFELELFKLSITIWSKIKKDLEIED